MLIQLTGITEVLDLFEAGVRTGLEDVARHPNTFKEGVQFMRTKRNIVPTLKTRQMGGNFVKGHAVTPVIAIAGAEDEITAGKRFRHRRGDLSYLVVFAGAADIKDGIMHHLT